MSSAEANSPAIRIFSLIEMLLGADAKFMHDDDHSLWSAMTDNDQFGGGPLAEAGPTQGQAGYKNAKAREKKRHNAAIKMVADHISDERLKDMILKLKSSLKRSEHSAEQNGDRASKAEVDLAESGRASGRAQLLS